MTVNMVSYFAVILYSQLLSPPVILFLLPKTCVLCVKKKFLLFFLNLGGLVRKIIETKKQLEASGTQQTKRTQVSFQVFHY